MDAQGETAVRAGGGLRVHLAARAWAAPSSTWPRARAGPAETVFLGVFRREALQAAGGFDETMHRAQDWELNHRLIAGAAG